MARFSTREAWLMEATRRMRPWLRKAGAGEVPPVRVSCAWPKRASRGSVGWCWHTHVSADGVNEIQVSPEHDEPVFVLQTLLHEMIHASDDGASNHSGYFRKTALAAGLEGRMTSTYAGDALRAKLAALASRLGTYPHAAMRPGAARPGQPGDPEGKGRDRIGKQSTRMIKVECPADGYIARTTRKWLDVGTPSCPCGQPMTETG